MEHLLLGGLAAGDELHVVHEEYVRRAVLLPKFGVAPFTDGLDELVGEGVALNIDDPVVRVVLVDLVGDGVQQVGLAQAGLAVDKQVWAGRSATAWAAAWANLLDAPTTNRSKVYSSVPGRKTSSVFFLPKSSSSPSPRTTTSKSAEKSSWSAFWITGR